MVVKVVSFPVGYECSFWL